MKNNFIYFSLFFILGFANQIKAQNSIVIGSQVWMNKNLDVAKFRNGDLIKEAKTINEWVQAGVNKEPMWCYYNFDSTGLKKYGKLYNWYAVNDSRGLAPKGWRVASDSDWTTLLAFLGADASIKLKSTEGWKDDFTIDKNGKLLQNSGNGKNKTTFSALPGGGLLNLKSPEDEPKFGDFGKRGFWWTADDNNENKSIVYSMSRYQNTGVQKAELLKTFGLSIRCLKER